MDLLGSILKSMDKPPVITREQKDLIKKQREDLEKRKQVEAETLKNFRENVEEIVNNFLKDDLAKDFKFSPMDQVCRSIIYDVCEVANILAFSFGEEGIDRHIVIFKKEFAPSEDYLNALRRGEEWNKDLAIKLREEREIFNKQNKKDAKSCEQKRKFTPNANYKDKYQHLIGKDAALAAARKTKTNSNYGCVPSENKKDQRSIEQTLADIREKRRKLQAQSEHDDINKNT